MYRCLLKEDIFFKQHSNIGRKTNNFFPNLSVPIAENITIKPNFAFKNWKWSRVEKSIFTYDTLRLFLRSSKIIKHTFFHSMSIFKPLNLGLSCYNILNSFHNIVMEVLFLWISNRHFLRHRRLRLLGGYYLLLLC